MAHPVGAKPSGQEFSWSRPLLGECSTPDLRPPPFSLTNHIDPFPAVAGGCDQSGAFSPRPIAVDDRGDVVPAQSHRSNPIAWIVYPSRSFLPTKTWAMIDFLRAELTGSGRAVATVSV
jgi:hypothetical protein